MPSSQTPGLGSGLSWLLLLPHRSLLTPLLPQQLSFMSQLFLYYSYKDTHNPEKALIASDACETGWIIDSGAMNHMPYVKSLFQYMTTPHRDSVHSYYEW